MGEGETKAAIAAAIQDDAKRKHAYYHNVWFASCVDLALRNPAPLTAVIDALLFLSEALSAASDREVERMKTGTSGVLYQNRA